ncbi:hypothetical protein HDU99_001466, partial [Rhizoclosmatium hyalinum]
AFGGSGTTTGVFGGANNTASAFGAVAGNSTSVFGGANATKSAFGGTGGSVFGGGSGNNASAFGGSTSSAFGTSTGGSAFGTASNASSAIGSTNTTNTPSAFGGSAFGQSATAGSAFGNSNTSAFGSAPTNAFGAATIGNNTSGNAPISAVSQASQESQKLLADPHAQHVAMRHGTLVPSQISSLVSEKIKSLPLVPVTNHVAFGTGGPIIPASSNSSTAQPIPSSATPAPNATQALATGFSFTQPKPEPAPAPIPTAAPSAPKKASKLKPVTVAPLQQQQQSVPTVIQREIDPKLLEMAEKWNLKYPAMVELHQEDLDELAADEFGGRENGKLIPEYVPLEYRV